MSSITTQVTSGFESLNDDTLAGKNSYYAYGAINKRSHGVYLASNMTKETFISGYAPLYMIIDRCDSYLDQWGYYCVARGVAYYNRRDVLLWAKRENIEEVLRKILYLASYEGRLDLLREVLSGVDESMNEVLRGYCHDAAVRAAGGGKLEVRFAFGLHDLQWLQDVGCQWDVETFYMGVYLADLELLEWLRNNNCPWDSECYERAAGQGHLDVLEWLLEHECPRGDSHIEFDYYGDHIEEDLKVWLRDNRFTVSYIESSLDEDY